MMVINLIKSHFATLIFLYSKAILVLWVILSCVLVYFLRSFASSVRFIGRSMELSGRLLGKRCPVCVRKVLFVLVLDCQFSCFSHLRFWDNCAISESFRLLDMHMNKLKITRTLVT